MKTMSETISQQSFDVDAVRCDFPILGKSLPSGKPVVYLDNAASAQKPWQVLTKEAEVYQNYYANAYRGVYEYGARVDEELDGSNQQEGSRIKIQKFIGASSPQEVIFTSGTTMSINLVANAWGRKFLQPGDEIVLNEMEHHANLVPWQQVAAEKGASLKFIPLTVDGRLDLDRIDLVLTDKTKLVAVTGMSNVLGTINPIAEVVFKAKACGAIVLVDGAQSVPHRPVDVLDPPIDFLAFSGHKLFGPTGIGVLYGRSELLDAMDAFLGGGHMIERVYRDHSTWAEVPAKFEAGTIPIVQGIALGAAVDYVNSIGFNAIQAYEHHLLEFATQRLSEVPGLTIYGPSSEHKGSIISFTVKGAHPEDLAQLLNLRGVFVRHGHHCTMPLHDLLGVTASVRASFAFYNTEAEVDALVDAIFFARQKLRLD